ncbi:MAG: hypothetical protein AB1760_20740 [Pseudomonadota bacterium]
MPGLRERLKTWALPVALLVMLALTLLKFPLALYRWARNRRGGSSRR